MQLIEIFKAGKRADANGHIVEITTQDLQQAVDAYDPAFHESPVVIGHPKDNHPAYAWVKSLQLDGDILKAELDQVDPEFAEMVEKGRYKKVSASFYLANSQSNPKQGSLYLRHVGFLGAIPPAVKGLRNPEFAENEDGVVEFADWTQATLFRRLRDWMIGKFGQEEADTTLPDYLVSSIQEEAVRESLKLSLTPEPSTIFNEPTQPQGDPEMSEQDKAELERLKAENQRLKDEKAQVEAQKAEAQLNQTKAENADFAESLVSGGKLAPVSKDKAIALLNYAAVQSAGGVVEFSEGENMLIAIKSFLESQPQIIQFAEVATKENAQDPQNDSVAYAEGTDPDSIEADKQVRAYMKEHNVDYTTAFNAIFN